MGSAGAFGDRHERPDPSGRLRETPAISNARVRLVVSDAVARTRVGQLGAWLAVNLLARLDGRVSEIELACPAVPVDPALVKLRMPRPETPTPSNLRDELASLCARVAGGRARVVDRDDGRGCAAEMIIGGTEVPRSGIEAAVWCFGRGWLAFAGASPEMACPDLHTDPNPLGMYLAVCYGVGEVFKTLHGLRDGRRAVIDRLYVSLWTGTEAAAWDDLQDGPRIAEVRLPPTYLAGAGAVGQAAVVAALTATAGVAFLTPVDGELIDRTNRNRYVLAFNEHEGIGKAAHVAEFAKAHGTPAFAGRLHWMPYAGRSDRHPDPAHAEKEADLRYELVLSCVDTNPARHDIQSYWPRDIIGGSTSGLRAQVAHYDLRTGTACLACHNPVYGFEASVDQLRNELKRLAPAERRDRLLKLDFAPEHIAHVLEYLERPKCGELGESVIREYAVKGPPTFSVGFVSVAAGLLVARTWICFALGGPSGTGPEGRHYLSMNFLNGRFLWTEQGMRQGCACDLSGRARWRALWTS